MARKILDVNDAADDFYAITDVEALAEQQGVGPLDFARARQLGKFWPEDESLDDFITAVRRWRDEEGDKEILSLG